MLEDKWPQNEAGLEEAISNIIDRKHCTLWLDWDVKNERGRTLAIQWAKDFYLDVEEELSSMN